MNAEDKLAIHELLTKAAYGLDMRNLDMLSQCFAIDATMSMRIAGGDLIGPFESRAGIMKLMTDSMDAQTDQRRHLVSNIFFTDESIDDKASVVSNLSLITIEDGEINLISTGVYQDDVIKTTEGWQLSNRYLDLDLPY